jgi:GTP cyclohydrolase II
MNRPAGAKSQNPSVAEARLWANLIGEPGPVAAERAVAELRAGRPVVVSDGGDATLVAALDGVSPGLFDAFGAIDGAALTLSAQRARVLGLSVDHPVATLLDGLTLTAAQRLAADPRGAAPPVWRPAELAAAGAIELCKRALFLPAALTAPVDAAAALPAHVHALTLDEILGVGPVVHELEVVSTADVPLARGMAARFMVFRGGPAPRDQVAVVVGDPDPVQPVLVRVHSACLTGDLFGSLKCDCGDQLRGAMDRLAEAGGGVLLYLDQEGRGIGIGNKMRAYALQQDGLDTIDADAILGFSADERRYEYAASILLKLGYRQVVLLTNNPEKVGALTKAGLKVVGRKPLFGAVNAHNRGYLATKAARSRHRLEDLLDPPVTGTSN